MAYSGVVVGATKIRDRGPDSSNWVLVIVAEGFTEDEQEDFEKAATTFENDLLSWAPFDDPVIGSLINIYRLDVWSTESGACNPATCGDGSIPYDSVATAPATYFDASFCADAYGVCGAGSIRRLLMVDTAAVETTVNTQVPEWDAIVVVVNSFEYGGSGGPDIPVYSRGTPTTTPIHELGHSAFGLADEYPAYAGCNYDEPDYYEYTGSEPDEPNVTINTDPTTLKWTSYVDPTTPIPTTENPDCTQCDTQPSPVALGTVGLFEGAYYHHCGVYRPEYDCMMNNNGQPFCKVCQARVEGRIRGASYLDCFVATAVYYDPMHPDVETIRRWRDCHLHPHSRGRVAMVALTEIYQLVGPPLARWVARRPSVAQSLRTWLFGPFAAWIRRIESKYTPISR